jgi:FAD/FMN-containing dehydrogenase
VGDLGAALDRVGLAMENIGDVAYQSIAGAVGTGTHGTGVRLGNLATQLVGARLVTGEGEVVDCDTQRRADLLPAVRVSLGALGVLTQVRLRTTVAQRLHRQAWCTHLDQVLAHLDELVESNTRFDFYWYPRSDLAQIRTINEAGREPELTVPVHHRHDDQWGPAHEVLPKPQTLRYEEMEYLVPAQAGPDCLREVRTRIRQRHRHYVGWRVLYRTIAADEAYLSPCYGRPTVSIALLQNATLPYQEYFSDLEAVFRAFDGRPHWGKRHGLSGRQLAELYPRWEEFQRLRRECDPHGRFLNPYLRHVLGED